MPGDGPFLFVRDGGPPAGFWRAPPGGMCLSAFLFVRRSAKILLGKIGEHPRWDQLAGLDPERVRNYGRGWTVPARQMKFGEDPRDTARSVGEEILELRGLEYTEPRVEVDLYEPPWLPGKQHYDVWFFVEAKVPGGLEPRKPAWYADLAWHDPDAIPAAAYARGHQDVVERWRRTATRPIGSARVPGTAAKPRP